MSAFLASKASSRSMSSLVLGLWTAPAPCVKLLLVPRFCWQRPAEPAVVTGTRAPRQARAPCLITALGAPGS